MYENRGDTEEEKRLTKASAVAARAAAMKIFLHHIATAYTHTRTHQTHKTHPSATAYLPNLNARKKIPAVPF